MIKETYSTSIKEKIEKIIESKIQNMRLQAKNTGKRPEGKWQEYLSEEALIDKFNDDEYEERISQE